MILCCLLLAGCGVKSVPAETALPSLPETVPATAPAVPETTVPETTPPDPVRQMISDMSLEQRVGQLFLARCNAETAIQDIQQYHLGGLVLFGEDFENQSMESMRQTIAAYHAAAEKPLLIAVDEEGGDVTRVSRFPPSGKDGFPPCERGTIWADWRRRWRRKMKSAAFFLISASM